jgi:hypothetical protein
LGGGIGYHLETYIELSSSIWGLLAGLGIVWYIPLLISLGLLAWLGWTWLPFLKTTEMSPNRILFLFSAATLVNLIALPYSWLHNLVLLLLPLGYSLALVLRMKSRSRIAWLALLFIIMHPLMLGLFIVFNAPTYTHAYQIIPALILLPSMCILEYRVAHQIQ